MLSKDQLAQRISDNLNRDKRAHQMVPQWRTRVRKIPVIGELLLWIGRLILLPKRFYALQPMVYQTKDDVRALRTRLEPSIFEEFVAVDLEFAALAPHKLYAEVDQFLEVEGKQYGDQERFYHALQHVLRGPETLISQRQVQYFTAIPFDKIGGTTPVLDVGCGRGEFLRLLRERGIKCQGIDLNSQQIKALHKEGFDVHCSDAITFLRELPDQSLGAITAFQFVEHLTPDYLSEFLSHSYAKLIDNGFVLLETVNPYCVETFQTYYLDPTHKNPIPLDLLAIQLQFSGFKNIRAFFQSVNGSMTPLQRDFRRAYENYALSGTKRSQSSEAQTP
jgi:2-polyprenyl-3-methyl-5-hydroxy-6-metoxy-1,4-benzoquinol methylase